MTGANRTALLLLGILALQAGLSYFHSLSFATVGQRSLVDLRRDTYARLISLPMTFFGQRRVGELASRLSADLIQIEDTLVTILPAVSPPNHDPHRRHRVDCGHVFEIDGHHAV